MKRTIALVTGLGLLVFGCGQAADPAAVVPAPAAQTAVPTTTTAVTTSENLGALSACSIMNDWGFPLVTSTGKNCQATQPVYSSMVSVITPSNASWGVSTGLPVRKGDLVSFSSASGSWGFLSQPSCSGGFFKFCTNFSWNNSCDSVSVTGLKDGSQLSNESKNAGLMAAIGGDIFYIGDNPQGHVAQADGFLQIGFNVPISDQKSTFCDSWSVTVLIRHCQDAGGNTIACQ